MASSLEEHYLNILGHPEEGNIPELEKKFKRKSAEYLITKTSDRVDISLIQRSGELTSAYLYLKAKWEINASDEPFIPRILRIDNPKKVPLTFLERVHLRLHNLCIAGLFFIGIISLFQLGESLLDNSLANAFSSQYDHEALANMIVEESKIRATSNAQVLDELKKSREVFEQKIEQKPISPIHAAARACNLSQLSSALNGNINLVDTDGASPLHWTSRRNCVKGSELLIRAGASLRIKDKTGKTALDWAKTSNNFESIRLLEKAGA